MLALSGFLVLLAYVLFAFIQADEIHGFIGAFFRPYFLYGVYFAAFPWEAVVFEYAIPFGVFFCVAQRYALEPSKSPGWMALTLFVWGFVLDVLYYPLLAFVEGLVMTGVPVVGLLSALSTPMGVVDAVRLATIFVMMGFAAAGFASFARGAVRGPVERFRDWLDKEPQPVEPEVLGVVLRRKGNEP